jgi:hypothetical protein
MANLPNSQQTCQTHSWTLPIDWCGMPTCQWYHHGWFESLSWNIQNLVIDSIILTKTIEDAICCTTCLTKSPNHHLNTPTSGLIPCMLSEPLRKSTHLLYQYMSPLATLPSVLFYKEGLHIFMEHSSKHWRGSPFTGLPHHHWVRVEIITIYFSSHSFHSTLISTNLFTSICHTACQTWRIDKSLCIRNILTNFLKTFWLRINESVKKTYKQTDCCERLIFAWYCHPKHHFDAQIPGCGWRCGTCKTISFIQKSKDLKVE